MLADQTYLLLDELLGQLSAEGFQPGLESRFRVQRWLDRLATSEEPVDARQLKFHMGALLAISAEAQERFYALFEKWIEPYWQTFDAPPPPPPPPDDAVVPPKPPVPPPPPAPVPDPVLPVAPLKPAKTAGRSGPLRIELLFPDDGLRVWNTPEMDQALRPLREKEWTTVREWDIGASIRRTIRSGGIPYFVQRFRKKAPQYLFFIDQKSPRDHLAGLYADLVLEMNRRDLDAEFYFYDSVPYRCWRDPRDLRSHTNIEGLQNQFPGAKLLLVGDVDDLLAMPDLRPSNLVLDLLDNWRQIALLTPKSTADWGEAERTLCSLFPIVPANAAGLATLLQQWNGTELYTPFYWQNTYPEPSLVDLPLNNAPAEAIETSFENLYYYLGDNGFQWLCAAAVYPEIYWELTKLLHDESIPPDSTLDEWDQNRVWQVALLRLSRVGWFRNGAMSPAVRKYLRQYSESELPAKQRDDIREQLLKVLNLNESRFPPGSYADANRAFTIAWYEYERAISAPNLSEAERARIEAEFREKGLAKIQLSEIEDVLGRRLFAEIEERALWPPVSEEPGYHVLWVDDRYEQNLELQKALEHEMQVHSVNVRDTDEALSRLAERGFHLIVSDVRRGDNRRAGIDMLLRFRERKVPTPVVYYTMPEYVKQFEEELRGMGAEAVLTGQDRLRLVMAYKTGIGVFNVLWVDDEPANNAQFQEYQSSLRPILFTNVSDTRQALKALHAQPFDLIISDIGRPGNRRAGVEMMEEFRKARIQIPVLFCTTESNVREFREELMRLGAVEVYDQYVDQEAFLRERMAKKETKEQNTPAESQKTEPPKPPLESPSKQEEQGWLSYYLDATKDLITRGEFEQAFSALQWLDKEFEAGYANDLVMQRANLLESENLFQQGLSTQENLGLTKARTTSALRQIIESIPRRLELNSNLGKPAIAPDINSTRGALEKAIGPGPDSLIQWLQNSVQYSRPVGRVATPNNSGTGFLAADGYLFTNYHLLRTIDDARTAKVEFTNRANQTTSYELDPAAGFVANEDLDFVRVKVKDRSDRPLKSWGYLDLDPGMSHLDKPLSIIQSSTRKDSPHSISLLPASTLREAILSYDGPVPANCEGAPMFNNQWKVVALHRFGHSGGFESILSVVDMGTAIKDIVAFLDQFSTTSPPPEPQTQTAHLLYNIPTQLQTGKKARATVRFAATNKLLLKNWKDHPDDKQVAVPLPSAGVLSIDLMETPQNESDDGLLLIYKPTNLTVRFNNPGKYYEWIFDIEPEEPGDSELSLHFEYLSKAEKDGPPGKKLELFVVAVTIEGKASAPISEEPDYASEREENPWLKNDPYEAIAVEEHRKESERPVDKSEMIAATRRDIAHDRVEEALHSIIAFADQSDSQWSKQYKRAAKNLQKRWQDLQKQLLGRSISGDAYSVKANEIRKDILELLSAIESDLKPGTNQIIQDSIEAGLKAVKVLIDSGQLENAVERLISIFYSFKVDNETMTEVKSIQAVYYQTKQSRDLGHIDPEEERLSNLELAERLLNLAERSFGETPLAATSNLFSRIRKFFTGN